VLTLNLASRTLYFAQIDARLAVAAVSDLIVLEPLQRSALPAYAGRPCTGSTAWRIRHRLNSALSHLKPVFLLMTNLCTQLRRVASGEARTDDRRGPR